MKILIEVMTPGNGKTYELLIDDRQTVGAAKGKIIEQIQSFEDGCISFGIDAALFEPISRTWLHDCSNIRKAGIKGGQRLFLL